LATTSREIRQRRIIVKLGEGYALGEAEREPGDEEEEEINVLRLSK
jgi:hypothetical protein